MSTKKGELMELKNELNSLNENVVKGAVKRVIAGMTVGKDVSMLFADVLKRMNTEDVELKKLVYLYIITYARVNPDKVLLSVNSFLNDAKHRSPLIRALAIRTIGCIRLPTVTDYFCKALELALKDGDPYVRKTAAVCVAKLFDVSPDSVEEHGFIKILRSMISDHNAMVVANAVAALAEIAQSTSKDVFKITPDLLSKLLAAMNECTEWGQVFILDCLAKYNPTEKQAEMVIERVIPLLVHVNSAVSLSAVKVIIKYLDSVRNASTKKFVLKEKIPNPLITLLSGDRPEVAYVALRNIDLILQKEPRLLDACIDHFYCKYNDPLYVKLEKLNIMCRIANGDNFDKLLLELRAYASEVDETFVRRAIRAVGRVAVKLRKAARRGMKVLLEIIKSNPGGDGEGKERTVGYKAQNAVAVMADILRKYPNEFTKVVDIIAKNGIDGFDEEAPRAAMIWILGEYSAIIQGAAPLLQAAIDEFDDLDAGGQLALLTATVKLFLKGPNDKTQAMIQGLLKRASANPDNPDLRDRAYVYWRMLSNDAKVAQQVILAKKPAMADDTGTLDPTVLKTLISNIGSVASVYHKPPELFVAGGKQSMELKGHSRRDISDSDESDSDDSDSEEDTDEDTDDSEDDSKRRRGRGRGGRRGADRKADRPAEAQETQKASAAVAPASVDYRKLPVVLTPAKGKGLAIKAGFARAAAGGIGLFLVFKNMSQTPIVAPRIKFNKNFAGLSPGSSAVDLPKGPIQPGGNARAAPLPVRAAPGDADATKAAGSVAMALKTEVGVVYFDVPLSYDTLFTPDGRVAQKQYLAMWGSLPAQEAKAAGSLAGSIAEAKSKLEALCVFFVAKREQSGVDHLYYSCKAVGVPVLMELAVSGTSVTGSAKASNMAVAQGALDAVVSKLGS